ncbi:hypothetical protein SDC9_165944 [bioreactor metagenome]|uniref:Uncharacterized protein n=1 Tax=bioreactor metagenome TaxID=1076179 RepID=A0A645G368_9ZZZZ
MNFLHGGQQSRCGKSHRGFCSFLVSPDPVQRGGIALLHSRQYSGILVFAFFAFSAIKGFPACLQNNSTACGKQLTGIANFNPGLIINMHRIKLGKVGLGN